MIEPFSHDDTQFVADTINRDTVERAHAILTGLIERGWTPPPATGGLVDPTRVYRVGEQRGCGPLPTEPWTDAQLKLAAIFNVTQCPNCGHSSQWHAWNGCDHQGCACPTVGTADTTQAKAIQAQADRQTYELTIVGSCGCGHSAGNHDTHGCNVVAQDVCHEGPPRDRTCECKVPIGKLTTKITGIGPEDTTP